MLCLAYLVPAAAETTKVARDEDWRALQAWLMDHREVNRIVTDTLTSQTLLFYLRSARGKRIYKGTVSAFLRYEERLPVDKIGGDPYLQTRYGARELPDPANGWRVVWRSPNGVLTLWQR